MVVIQSYSYGCKFHVQGHAKSNSTFDEVVVRKSSTKVGIQVRYVTIMVKDSGLSISLNSIA